MGDVIEILTTATNTVEVEAQGPQGIPGVGVPTGGSALQVLRKKTGTDYDTEWAAAGSGSGSVTSVALASTDLTISGSPITDSGTITANIAANAVTLEKLQTISSEHLLGRHGSGNGGVQQVGLGAGLAISGSNLQVTTTPSDIGAQSAQVTETLSLSASVTLTASRSKLWKISNNTFSNYFVELPTTGISVGDIVEIEYTSSTGRLLEIRRDGISFGQSLPNNTRNSYRLDTASANGWTQISLNYSNASFLFFTQPDALLGRLSGASGQAQEISCTAAGRALLDDADAAAQRTTLGLGTAATAATGEFAAASHSHGNINSSGQIGSDSGRVLVTTTAGAVTTLALGTANQVLRVNSGASGVEFADPSGGGVTGAAASASDVLGVSGANITGVDAGSADRLVFWDDSAGKLTHLALGSNALSIDGTTLKSQPLFPVEPVSRGATYIPYIGSGSNGNSSSAVNTSGGFVLFAPVYIRKSGNYTTFSCIVSTAGSASSLGKMALYTIKAADALPDALVCQSGTFTTDSTGIKQPTMASTFVTEGWYYMAIGTNSTTNMTFYGDTMLLLRGVFSGAALNQVSALLDYSQKLYADFWPNPWNGTSSTFRNAFHPITSLT